MKYWLIPLLIVTAILAILCVMTFKGSRIPVNQTAKEAWTIDMDGQR